MGKDTARPAIDDGYAEERESVQNLIEGLEFEILNPQFKGVSCQQCMKYWFDPRKGEFAFYPDAAGKPKAMLRPRDEAPVLCETDIGCVKGHFAKPKGLNEKNRKAVKHYKACEEAGVIPDDPIVRRTGILIQQVEAKLGKKYG